MTRHTVILPCFNGNDFIIEAISSVMSQLGPDDELIVVDDGSTDQSIGLINSIGDKRIRLVIRKKNGGISAARNDAFPLIRGDFVSFIDQDDLWGEGRVKDFESVIAKHPDADVVYGVVKHFYDDVALAMHYQLPETQIAVLPGSVTLSRDLVTKVGLFDITITCGEFIDYMARAKLITDHWHSSEVIYQHRRIHGKNYTLTHAKDSSGYPAVVRAHLLRKRAAIK